MAKTNKTKDDDTEPKAELELGESIIASDLAEKLGEPPSSVIKALMQVGIMATLNDAIDFDTASIVASEFGFETKKAQDESKETGTTRQKRVIKKDAKLSPRPPVVAVMGHVDHGKTSLLDAIRGSSVVTGESGGITQHISAYHIEHGGRPITLLDTPGHEAFSALREHGAVMTDVAIIVVAADDGIKPQTKEAIKFARTAGVQIVVALNKIDKPSADINKVKQQLVDEGLAPEDWGGDTVVVPVSAKTNEGIDNLLDMAFLIADINELKAEVDIPAEGIVIESRMEKGQGPVATLLVEHGLINAGDVIVAGSTYAKSRVLTNEQGKAIMQAGPSRAVTVSGFKSIPAFGDTFRVVASEKEARKVIVATDLRAIAAPDASGKAPTTADEFLSNIDQSLKTKNLYLIIKADVIGSLESLVGAIKSIGNDEVSARIITSGIGNITESDVLRAQATNSKILGFHVSISSTVKRMAHNQGVSVKIFTVIYELIDDVKSQLESLLEPEVSETVLGKLLVKGVFRQTRSQTICGGEVTDGKALPNSTVRVFREGKEIAEAKSVKVKREQNEAKEVLQGELCGIELASAQKLSITEGDELIFVSRQETARQL